MRGLYLWDAGEESPELGFRRDQALLAALGRTAAGGAAAAQAYARLWYWPVPGLAFGRYHRMPGCGRQLGRRLSGGKIVALGPGILGATLVLPGVLWLDPGKAPLRPEQILNRALRPLLGLLRQLGVSAFYPGRDVVSIDGRVIAHAAFTLMPDGALLIEQHLSLSSRLSESSSLLASLDPAGVAASDPSAFENSVSLEEIATIPPYGEWPALMAEQMRLSFACSVVAAEQPPNQLAGMQELGGQAFSIFCAEREALSEGWISAVSRQSLGIVEVAARTVQGRIAELQISGDVIAPVATLEAVAENCVGHVPAPATVKRALAAVLSRPGHFLFGADDLDDLVGRMG